MTSCYLTLLVEVLHYLKLPLAKDGNPCTVTCSESEIMQKISAYECLFPLEPPTDSYWKILVDSLFQQVAMEELRVLPVVRNKTQGAFHQPSSSRTAFDVTWLPFNGSGRDQAFFNSLAEESPFSKRQPRRRLKEVLLESRFNLVAFSLELHQSLKRSDIPTHCISSSSVISFFKSVTSPDPLCKIGPIPCSVNETAFKDALGIILVLLYCKGVEDFVGQLPGLPLLLTNDNNLRMFLSKKPKFLSQFQDILPGSPNTFMHELVEQKVFQDVLTKKSSVLRPLNLQGFAANLPQTLEVEHYGQGCSVEWFPNQAGLPNKRWSARFSFFLSTITMNEVFWDPKSSEETKSLHLKASLELLA